MSRKTIRLALPVPAVLLAGCSFLPGSAPPPAADPAVRERCPVPAGLPAHPRDIAYAEFPFEVPDGKPYRVELANGLVAYCVEDARRPVIHLTAWIRAGAVHEPKEKTGLAGLAADLLRSGGVEGKTPDEVDEELDRLASTIGFGAEPWNGTASLFCLQRNADRTLDLLSRMLKTPAFDGERLQTAKDQAIQEILHKNDDPQEIGRREFTKLMYGAHPVTREATIESVRSIAREDLQRFHKDYVRPERTILAVTSALGRDAMKALLEKHLGSWEKGAAPLPETAMETQEPAPGVYAIDKDVNQGTVYLAHLGIRQDDPDRVPLEVMDAVLGGASFTSRLVSRIRVQEGLSYGVSSWVSAGRFLRGTIRASFQPKVESVPFAISLALEEFRKIREQPVPADELAGARKQLAESFPGGFSTPQQRASFFARAEFFREPEEYYKTYRRKVLAVTAEEVLRVAQKHLAPEKFAILCVGRKKEMTAGDGQHPATLRNFGPVTDIPLETPRPPDAAAPQNGKGE